MQRKSVGKGHGAVLKTYGNMPKEHSNTTIGSLRAIYGEQFAKGFGGDEKLTAVIAKKSKVGASSYHVQKSHASAKRKGGSGRNVSSASLDALANATVLLGPALKRLADR